MVIWLHPKVRTEGCTQFAMDWAAGGGHLEIVRFLNENYPDYKFIKICKKTEKIQ